jgi:hypothetical protein
VAPWEHGGSDRAGCSAALLLLPLPLLVRDAFQDPTKGPVPAPLSLPEGIEGNGPAMAMLWPWWARSVLVRAASVLEPLVARCRRANLREVRTHLQSLTAYQDTALSSQEDERSGAMAATCSATRRAWLGYSPVGSEWMEWWCSEGLKPWHREAVSRRAYHLCAKTKRLPCLQLR